MIRCVAGMFPILVLASPLGAQDRLSGDWQGFWYRSGDSMAVTLHVTENPAQRTWSASFDSERLRVMGIPFAEVTVAGCCAVTMRLQGDQTTTLFTVSVHRDSLTGEFQEGESRGRVAYSRVRSNRPPLVEREIVFQNGAVSLSGTLLLPPGPGRFPAVVFVHGSGAEGRWASRFLAATLARQGVAALIFDKRGVGKSTGDWRTASLDDLVGDAAAAIEALRHDPRIDPARIGVHGHSQGGTLAPMIAVRGKAGFIIASAAAGTPTDSTEIYSVLNSVLPDARTAADSADARTYTGELVTAAYHGSSPARLDSMVARFQGRPWFFAPPPPESSYWSFSKIFGTYRPLDWWTQVRVPVLLIYGARDQRVPPNESAARIAAALARGSATADVTVRIIPGADHTFRLPPGPGGWPVTAPEYLPALLGWIRTTRFEARPADPLE